MEGFNWADIHDMLGKEGEPITALQMSLRACVLFLYGILLIRLAGTRIFGKSAPLDIIMSVIIGSNLSRCLTGNAPLLPTMVATAVLLTLHWALARFAHHHRGFATLVKGKPAVLIADGSIDYGAMRHEGIGMRDLETAVRESGLADVDEVRRATLERDGSISVIEKD